MVSWMDYSCFHSENETTKAQALHDDSSLRHRVGQLGQKAEPHQRQSGAFPQDVVKATQSCVTCLSLNFHRRLALASWRTELNKQKEKMFVTNTKEKSVCSQDTERVVQPSEFIHAFSRTL